jgi:eukaryotic translation initiation factor 2C
MIVEIKARKEGAMGFDAATISSNDDNFDLDRWRKNFKDKHVHT